MPNVLIYRDQLLPLSETFILSQADAMTRYVPLFVGSERVPGLPLSPGRCLTLAGESRSARLAHRAAKLLGHIHPDKVERLRSLNGVLVHAHFGHDAVFALPLVRRLGLPFLVSFHGYDLARRHARPPDLRPGELYRRAHAAWVEQRYPAVFARAQRVIAPSAFLAARLAALGCPPEKIQVHHIGLDVDRFTAPPGGTRQPVVLFIGRLVEKKGVDTLIRAMSIVQAAEPGLRLVVGGDGPLRPSLEAMAAHGLSNVEFLGRLHHDSVRDWLARTSLMCVPSVQSRGGDVEGIPFALLEAQAMGVPVIASDHAGIPEVVSDGETGLLAAERDVLGLAGAILRLWQDPALRQRLAAAARRQIETQFSLARNTAALEDLYDEVIEEFRST